MNEGGTIREVVGSSTLGPKGAEPRIFRESRYRGDTNRLTLISGSLVADSFAATDISGRIIRDIRDFTYALGEGLNAKGTRIIIFE